MHTFSDGRCTFQYNEAGRLAATTCGQSTTTFAYSANGLCVGEYDAW